MFLGLYKAFWRGQYEAFIKAFSGGYITRIPGLCRAFNGVYIKHFAGWYKAFCGGYIKSFAGGYIKCFPGLYKAFCGGYIKLFAGLYIAYHWLTLTLLIFSFVNLASRWSTFIFGQHFSIVFISKRHVNVRVSSVVT